MTGMPQSLAIRLGRALTRTRLGTALFSGARTLIVSVLRTFYVLWLEVTGVLFAIITLMGASDLVRHYHAGTLISDPKRLWITLAGTLICGWFTLVSFVRAKRTRKR